MGRKKGVPNPLKPPVKYSRHGVPIDRNNWTERDWEITWIGLQAIRAAIARNHGQVKDRPDPTKESGTP